MSADIAYPAIHGNSTQLAVGRIPQTELNLTFDSSLLLADPYGARAEAFRALRTQLVAQHLDDGKRALAVCGASPGIGCTFVATNLAIAFSQIGVRTLLIDGDLRRPGVDQLIRPDRPAAGLLECLVSPNMHLSDFIAGEVQPNLSVMFSSAAPNPQELLAERRFRELLNFCLRNFDLTIVDTSPANNSSDSRLVASLLGYCLVVARRDKSSFADTKTLSEELQTAGARIVGTVLNEG